FQLVRIEYRACDDPYELVIALNIRRRHLTGEQKRDLIAMLLKQRPRKSDRQVATTVGVHHSTVGSVRASLEGRGEISHVETRTDTEGRKHAGRRSSPSPSGRCFWGWSKNSVTPPIDEESAQPVPRKFTPSETLTDITWAIKALCHAIEGTAPAEVV